MSAGNVHHVIVGVEPDTTVELVRGADSYPAVATRAGCDRVNVGGATIWLGYLASDDADVVAACDHLIEALQQVRSHALQRLAAAVPEEAAS